MKRRRKSKFQNSDQSSSTPTTPDDFSFSLTKIAVSQICRSIGYKSTESSITLDSLTLITTRFLQSLAGLAASFSNAANRTEVNLFDIVNALQNLSLSTSDYFPGGSTLHNTESNRLIESVVLRNLSDFVTNAPEIPFAKPLPKRVIEGSSERDLPVNRSPEMKNYVPAWLPPFPEASLYIENCTEERSDHLWENSDSVIGCEILPESSRSESNSRGGILPVRRARVRFKVSSSGGDNRLERWRDNNDGESGREFEGRKKISEEFIYNAGIVAGEWPI